MSSNAVLKKEFEYYTKNQEKLLKEYNGKFLVIKDSEVIGVYEDARTAIDTTAKDHAMGTFLVQKCTPGDADYTVTFHSRVA